MLLTSLNWSGIVEDVQKSDFFANVTELGNPRTNKLSLEGSDDEQLSPALSFR